MHDNRYDHRDSNPPTILTHHAHARSRTRGISQEGIAAAFDYGRLRSIRGADVYTLGWREVQHYSRLGVDLSRWSGIEVVCAHSGEVITVYRNRSASGLRRPSQQQVA